MDAMNFLFNWSRADWQLKDPGNAGAIESARTGIADFVTAGAETRTLASPPRAGLLLGLNMVTDGGDCVITAAAAINTAGNTIITLHDAGDFVLLMSRKFTGGTGFRWVVVLNNGASLS